MSVAVHGGLLSVLLIIPLIFHDSIRVHFDTILIAPPMPKLHVLEVTHYKAPPPPKPQKPLVASPPKKPVVIEPPEIKKLAEVKLPDVIQREKPLPPSNVHIEEAAPAAPKMEVRTNVFSSGSSAKPTTNLPAQQVQTGGFGDPNGIKGEGKPGKVATIASLGSFDLPAGSGAGNGTGGAHGVKGTVISSGFGNGVAAVGSGSGAGSERTVHQGGFADTEAVKPDAARKRDLGPPTSPVEILFKPKPDYTEEARKLKLEGEVLVRILFTAGGEVKVLDVARGLGHGLDESALRAAQQIRFKPALREGQPVDSTATVHIVFQLAY